LPLVDDAISHNPIYTAFDDWCIFDFSNWILLLYLIAARGLLNRLREEDSLEKF